MSPAHSKTFVGLIPCQVLLSSERLGENDSPIDVANLMEKCIRIYYLCVTYCEIHQIQTSFGDLHNEQEILVM
jgi:hypothetical protein